MAFKGAPETRPLTPLSQSRGRRLQNIGGGTKAEETQVEGRRNVWAVNRTTEGRLARDCAA